MKVLHVISGLRQTAGGTVTALLGLAQAQHRQGMHVAIAASFVRPEDDEAASLRAAGLEVHQIGPCRDPRSRHAQIGAWIEQLARDADVVHIHALWETIQHAAARRCQRLGVPYVITPHGMLDPWSLAQGALKKKLYIALRLRRNLNRAAAIHFTTTTERDLVMGPLRLKAPAVVEPNGLDLSEFDSLPPRGTFRARFPQIGQRRAVIFLGRLHHKKGLDLLIPAFARGAPADAILVLAGPDDDGYQRKVEQIIEENDLASRVVFTGMLRGRERVEALVDADLFVLPSYQENFGIAVIEALAAGCPVVISDQVNIHNEITAARVGAVVPTEVGALSMEIASWLNDAKLREDVGRRGPAFVRERYDWNRIARDWVTIYERLGSASVSARSARIAPVTAPSPRQSAR
jgi:glycosyltransferase involved in cell wall biosynthesis